MILLKLNRDENDRLTVGLVALPESLFYKLKRHEKGN